MTVAFLPWIVNDEIVPGSETSQTTKVELTFKFLECECQLEFGSKDLTGGVVTDFLDGREKPAPPSFIGKLEAILREQAAARGYKFLSRQDLHRLVKPNFPKYWDKNPKILYYSRSSTLLCALCSL